MDLRLLLCQIAIKHSTEDGASHGQHILEGREEQTDASVTRAARNQASVLSVCSELPLLPY